VLAILKLTGDWQKYKGEPAPAPLLVAEPKADKRALFEAAAKDTADEPKGEAITPKAKKADKAEKKADDAEATAPAESTEA
jgi:small subunit ribosomal protein S16